MRWFFSKAKDGGREEGQNAMPAQKARKGATLDPLVEGLDSTAISRRRMLGLAGGAAVGATLLGAMPKPASALTVISQVSNPAQFVTPHYLVMPSTGGRTYVALTGIVLATLKGISETQWRRETFRILPSLSDARQAAGFPGNYWFRAVHGTAFATLSAIYNDNVANDAGWAIDAFRLVNLRTLLPHAILEVDTAVRDTDGYILRLGYNIAMLGTFEESDLT
jgi:hypothetical protein